MEANIVKVLLIEDDKVDEMAFKRLVDAENLPYHYTVARSVAEAREILDSEKFDAIIADYHLGDGTAFDILDLMTDAPVIFATGAGDEEVAVKAMKMDAYDYLIKDQERNYLKMLPATVANAIKHRETEENIRMLSHAMMGISDSVYITDKDGTIIFVNKAFCETYGYKGEEILGQNCRLLWKLESADEVEEQCIPKRVEDGGNDEFYHKRKDGSYFPVSLSKSPIKDKKGRDVAFVGVVRDITKRKRAEEALRSAEAKSRLILQTMPSGLFTVDLQRKITSWNKEAEEITGLKADNVLDRDCIDVLDCDACRSGCDLFDDTVDKPSYGKECVIDVGGKVATIAKNLDLLKDLHGRTIGGLESFVDISDRKRAEEEREKLIKELKDALRKVKTLSGLLPICASCKKIRDDKGYWNQIESYIRDHSEAEFSHSLCPECLKKLYPELGQR